MINEINQFIVNSFGLLAVYPVFGTFLLVWTCGFASVLYDSRELSLRNVFWVLSDNIYEKLIKISNKLIKFLKELVDFYVELIRGKKK